MSTIIESMARGVKNALPGVGVGEATAQRQLGRGNELIKKLALGGLALGTGTGAAVALFNYIKSLSDESEVNDEGRLNDDTLYVPMQHKAASLGETIQRWTAPGLAVTGGILGAGGAYALTQAVYNYIQKKRRQSMLDEAQNETLQAADAEASKSASASMTFSDLVIAAPVAVPLLAALASGGVAYAALNKTFPVVGKPKSKFPKRVRAVTEEGGVEKLDPSLAKQAAEALAEADCESSGYEYLALFADSVAMEKKAFCITSEIINSVAKRGLAEVERAYKNHGLTALCELVKGAADQPASQADKVLATCAIFKSARLTPVVSSVAAAEFLDLMPTVVAMCGTMDHEKLEKLAGLGVLLNISINRPLLLSKSAATASPGLFEELIAALQMRRAQQAEQPPVEGAQPFADGQSSNVGGDGSEEDRDAAMTSDLSGSMGEDNEGGDLKDSTDDNESQAHNDEIDQFMADPKSVRPGA